MFILVHGKQQTPAWASVTQYVHYDICVCVHVFVQSIYIHTHALYRAAVMLHLNIPKVSVFRPQGAQAVHVPAKYQVKIHAMR